MLKGIFTNSKDNAIPFHTFSERKPQMKCTVYVDSLLLICSFSL